MSAMTIAASKAIAKASGGILTEADERDRLQACADQHLADNRDLATHLQECELWPEDSEIVVGIRHMFMATWGLDAAQTDARMPHLDWVKAIAGAAA